MIAADGAFSLGLLRDSAGVGALASGLARQPTVIAAAAWSLGELAESARSAIEQVLRTEQPKAALSDVARRGYYKGLAFHRVVPSFVAQDGDPRGDGSGGPGYAIRDELNRRWYDRGAVGMALSGPDTGGSQYFLAHSRQPHLDGHYTVFGHVIAGFDVLDALVQGGRILSITID